MLVLIRIINPNGGVEYEGQKGRHHAERFVDRAIRSGHQITISRPDFRLEPVAKPAPAPRAKPAKPAKPAK